MTRFPYEDHTTWSQDLDQRRRWNEALEKTGAEQVREILRKSKGGAAGSVAVGTEINVVIGFCHEWLNWHDQQKLAREQQKAARESTFRRQQLTVAWVTAGAGWTVAIIAVLGWYFATGK